jgi:hypothetical protein
MANICNNEFYAYSEDSRNIEFINKFFEKYFSFYDEYDESDEYINIRFDSKWTFPEDLMEELRKGIPNKDDIYMRCMSIEYGCLYHELGTVYDN